MLLPERFLHRMEVASLRESLDRGDLSALGLDGEHGARLDGAAVEEDGAGAALAGVAADVGTREAELLAQEAHEQLPRLDVGLALHPVDGKLNRNAHAAKPLGRARVTGGAPIMPQQPREGRERHVTDTRHNACNTGLRDPSRVREIAMA